MSQSPAASYALVTVSSAAFVAATEVLLYSVLKYNPWFKGELVVIADDLTADQQARLCRHHPVCFQQPDPRLAEAARGLRDQLPEQPDVFRRFYSFEAFRLTGYRRLLYLDSDICCTGDIARLFTAQDPLLACPDGFTYGDRILARLAEAEGRSHSSSQRYGRVFESSFNAGVLSIGEELLDGSSYEKLLALLDGESWRALGASKFTDQMALNIVFENRFKALEGIYNYMIFLEQYQRALEGISFPEARLLHFAGTIKPWNRYAAGDLLARAPQFIKFFDVWRELLEETRGEDPLASLAAGYRRQKDWIDAYNRNPLEPVGLLTDEG